jgi:hypothetical protein
LTYLLLKRVAGEGLLQYYAMRAAELAGRAPPTAPDAHENPKQFWSTPAKPVEQLVTLRAPANILDGTQLVCQSGRTLYLSADRTVVVSREDATALRIGGWQQVQVEPVA